MRKYLFAIFALSLLLGASQELDYLNSLRMKTGLISYSKENQLDEAAMNHSYYMQTNNIFSHSESNNYDGFTGASPSDRAVYTGYYSRSVSENISYGQSNYMESIDGLFSAIYHRFGFLDLDFDEMGIGISENGLFYTFDMGNSLLDKLCKNADYSADGTYYTGVCDDEDKKVEVSEYDAALSQLRKDGPDIIIWPSENSDNVPPVFYEESPDPLPDQSVTGYPISIEFNSESFEDPPTIKSFKVLSDAGHSISPLIIMDNDNDPHDRFLPYQYAFFPEKRLEWGERYFVQIDYNYDNLSENIDWCFTTRSLASIADRFYRIENNQDISVSVVSGVSYAVYVIPRDANDILGKASYNYTAKTDFSYIDRNTFKITLVGQKDDYAIVEFENGQKIEFTISGKDSALSPANKRCINNVEKPLFNPALIMYLLNT
jgi:hypothetical protein